ncbi:MAG: carbon starvation protein A, partial [Myxococcales bacterium]|nr:carbon starvation protein A [Myxococcales bacterium]
IFIGAVHDFSTLVASVRHDARSIAEVVRENLGQRAFVAMMAFIWLALIYVVVAFTDVTASTFVSGDADMEGLTFRFNPGGAVAASSIFYLTISIVMGFVERFLKPPQWVLTVVFVPAALGAVWLGTEVSTWFLLSQGTWSVLILIYCFVASQTPVWALLQPRGFLGGFICYIALGVGTIGILFGGYEIKQPAFTGFDVGGATGLLFPFLFVTIACGACSGFHGLVCSGTTSKQISNESHCHPVGYGAMLLEAFVALIALGTIMIVAPADTTGRGPGAIYGQGLGQFLALLIGKDHIMIATTFGAMAFSTFVFDTLDVATRLGRYILEELFGLKGRVKSVVATFITCALPLGFLMLAKPGSYKLFWTLFGTSNQLLAGLSLLGITVWLKRSGKRYAYTLWPMVFVLGITLWSLVLQMKPLITSGAALLQRMNGVVAVALFVLAVGLLVQGARVLHGAAAPGAPNTAP